MPGYMVQLSYTCLWLVRNSDRYKELSVWFSYVFDSYILLPWSFLLEILPSSGFMSGSMLGPKGAICAMFPWVFKVLNFFMLERPFKVLKLWLLLTSKFTFSNAQCTYTVQNKKLLDKWKFIINIVKELDQLNIVN